MHAARAAAARAAAGQGGCRGGGCWGRRLRGGGGCGGAQGTSPVFLCLRNLRSPVPRSFHILTSFSHESDSHRNSFARLRIRRRWHASASGGVCTAGPPPPPPASSHLYPRNVAAGPDRGRAGRQVAAYILKIASSSSSPFAVFTSSSCTSGLNSTCRGRGQRDFEQTRQAPPHGLSTWAAHLRLLLFRELIVIAVTITTGLG